MIITRLAYIQNFNFKFNNDTNFKKRFLFN